jgi:hypothetical protein
VIEHIRAFRLLLLFEAVTFVAAVSIHFGAFLDGYTHHKAGTAETVIAIVLLAGCALTWGGSSRARAAVIGAQAFGAFGVCVGLFTIAVGVGPRTLLDVVYHLAILATLAAGVVAAARLPSSDQAASSEPAARARCAATKSRYQ